MTRTQQNIAYLGVWAVIFGALFFYKMAPDHKKGRALLGYLLGCTLGGIFMWWVVHWR